MKLQQLVEEKVGFLIVFTFITISIGLLVQVIPLFFTKEVITATEGGGYQTDRRSQTLQRPASGRTRHLCARRLLQLPLATNPPVPRRN